MPGECAAINAVEADEYVDVVRSNTLVHSDMEFEGFTFIESVSYAFLKNLGWVLDTSGLPLCRFLINLIFTLLWLSLVKFTYWPLCKSFKLLISVRTISRRWHHEVVGFQCMFRLESLLVVRSVPGQTSLNRLDRNLKLVGDL